MSYMDMEYEEKCGRLIGTRILIIGSGSKCCTVGMGGGREGRKERPTTGFKCFAPLLQGWTWTGNGTGYWNFPSNK